VSSEEASPRAIDARDSAVALEAIATLTWALPLAFCFTYAAAWAFSLKNLLLITGHLFVLGSASLVAEAASRLSHRPQLAGLARLTQGLAVLVMICLLYGFYPMIRMFLESDKAFVAAIESADPASRLALTTIVAYGLGAATIAAFSALLSRAAGQFEQKLGGLQLVIVAAFLLAGLAAALHAAFAARTELRDLRHWLAFGLVSVGILAFTKLYPAIQRVAQCLHREAATQS
jgi:hypothetical protein